MGDSRDTSRWTPRPFQARLIRLAVLVAPIGASMVFVALVSKVFPAPLGSFWVYAAWWVLLTGGATAVLIAVDRLARKLLPLAVLFKLSLVFPDQAPSRFRTALSTRSEGTLAERVAAAKAGQIGTTPVEAAQELLALVGALDTHDPLTKGHSDRVRAYSQMIAEEMSLGDEAVDLLNWAALLHDIGKLEIPTEILAKEGRPSEEEWAILRQHPELGDTIVAPLRSWLAECTDAVPQHHERWDGTGYPRGLAGDQIGLAGRIVAVADVFDVITSARSYKSASDSLAGREEIARHAGTQFDPRVVRAFLAISLGRLRFAMGPLSWLSHAPFLGRLPLTPAIGTVSSVLAVAAGALATGAVAPAIPAEQAFAATPAATATNVAVAVDEDASVVIRIPATSGGGRVRIVRQPSNGLATLIGNGVVRYVPPRNFAGVVSFDYEVCDEERRCRRATVRVVVRQVNDDPIARADVLTVAEDLAIAMDVLANDSDPDGDRLTVSGLHNLSEGTGRVVDGRVQIRLPTGFNGKVTFAYTAADGEGGAARADATVFVEPHNDAPVAVPDTVRTPRDTPVKVTVLDNDGDPDGDPVWVLRASEPSAGSTANDGTAVTYAPPKGFRGAARFSYTISDPGRARSTARVVVLVGDVDPAPAAPDDEVPVKVEEPAPVPGPVEPPPRPAAPVAPQPPPVEAPQPEPPPAEPEPGPSPPPEAPNAAPTFVGGGNQTVLEDAGPQTIPNWATGVSPGPPAEGTQTVSFQISETNPGLFAAGGRPAVAQDGTLRFTPAPDASGASTVTVVAVDDGGTAGGGVNSSGPQTFTITVSAVNDAPTFALGSGPVTLEDAGPQSVTGFAGAIAAGPTDEGGQSITFVVMNSNNLLFTGGGQPALAPNGTLTFTGAPNVSGSAVLTVQAVDDGGSANGGVDTSLAQAVTIQITPQPDAPVATDDAASVSEDAAGVTFDVLGNDSDVDGDPLTLVSFDGAAIQNGVLTPNGGGSFTYVPDPAFSGSETFTYVAGDGTGRTDTGAVTVTVTPQPDDPVAGADAFATGQATVLTVPAPGLLANDYDEDGDALTVDSSLVLAPTNGVAVISANGSLVYTPNALFVGTDVLSYRIDDGTGRTAVGTVSITVDSTISSSTLYLQPTGPSADVWDMSTAAPPAASPVPDHDGDGDPGLTIKSSNGNESENDTAKYQIWTYVVASPLQLNGPVAVQLWSTLKQFRTDKNGHPHFYLYDCAPGGASCVKIAETDEHVDDWNGSTSNWVYHDFTIGSVNRLIAGGRELRVRLQMKHEDFWVALTSAYPSALVITTG